MRKPKPDITGNQTHRVAPAKHAIEVLRNLALLDAHVAHLGHVAHHRRLAGGGGQLSHPVPDELLDVDKVVQGLPISSIPV